MTEFQTACRLDALFNKTPATEIMEHTAHAPGSVAVCSMVAPL
jgi:hypothetical protein